MPEVNIPLLIGTEHSPIPSCISRHDRTSDSKENPDISDFGIKSPVTGSYL